MPNQSILPHEAEWLFFDAATLSDLDEITAISVRAFHSDLNCGSNTQKGPPGYDSTDFHRKMLQEATCFYKIIVDQKIIGAFWFMKNEDQGAYLYRIFIEPDYHKNGIGLKSFNFLFEHFPEIKYWTLKTPTWNSRTPNFYNKLGFKVTREDERFNYFEKQVA